MAAGRYERRLARVEQLLSLEDHAAEILGLYRVVLTLQQPLHDWAAALFHATHAAQPPGDLSPDPRLALDRLPAEELATRLSNYAETLAPVATPELADAAARLAGSPGPARQLLLRRTLGREDLDELAGDFACPVPHLVFFSRGFLQPIVEALTVRATNTPQEDPSRVCPRCGWPPQVATLRDDGETRGRRLLICGLCAEPWPFPRATCPSCLERDAEKLPVHEDAARPFLRVEECTLCKAYIKCVDARQDGRAEPLVDDIASVELDLWSAQRGLWKPLPNLFGF
jgi:formate dehydrogenase maturation protein FdhE